MSKQKPRRHEDMLADVERWNLELANEVGVIGEVGADRQVSVRRPVLKSTHLLSARKSDPETKGPVE